MKVLAVDPQQSKTVIYYSSPETVDFRSLLRDLSSTLARPDRAASRSADRDAVRVTGAIGSCGRDTCCSTFLRDYDPITLEMARDQDLPAEPDAHLRCVRAVDVLPEVRAPDVSAVQGDHPGESARRSSRRHGDGIVDRTQRAWTTRWWSSSPPTAHARSATGRRCAGRARPTNPADRSPGAAFSRGSGRNDVAPFTRRRAGRYRCTRSSASPAPGVRRRSHPRRWR